jgi:hypothetical protein
MIDKSVCRACFIMLSTLLAAGFAAAQPTFTKQAPDPGAWTVSLNGTWEFTPPGADAARPVSVPGFWSPSPDPHQQQPAWKIASEWPSATYRRDFQLPDGMTGAVVEFDQLRWGGEVLANGRSAGKYDLGHSLVTFDVSGMIKPGVNKLEVRPRGYPALERWQGKHIQVPIGAGNWFGPKVGGIPDDVRLRLFKGALIDSLTITPHIAGPACDLATRVVAGPADWNGFLAVQVLTDDGAAAASPVMKVDVSAKAGQAAEAAFKNIACPGAALWWPEKPVLYRLVAWLEGPDGSVAAVRDDTFGFRETAWRDGHFYLNDRRYNLFGATEWVMGNILPMLDDKEQIQRVQVKLFRAMNGVAFRSHQNPLPRRLMDLYDRNGILLLCEFPNFPDVQRQDGQSPYEVPHYWENLQREIRGIIAARVNHPCIVGWVPSNEGTTFGDWERANLEPFVKSVDPTRLVLFSGDVTPDVADQHNFAGMWWGTQGESERAVLELARLNPNRITGCTEYGQFGGGKRWYGTRDRPEDPLEFQRDLSRILMEQTESMRRARFTIIMPYSYGWHGRKAAETGRIQDAQEAYHALRNAISPLGVSIDCRRHAVAGTTIAVPVWAMSDSQDVKGPVEVTLCLLDRHPGYNWDGNVEQFKVLAKGSYSTQLAPWQAYHQVIQLPLPKHEAACFLAATVRPKDAPQPSAISLRALRIYPPLAPAKASLTVGVIEKDGRLEKWLKARGHRIVLTYGIPNPDVILVGEGMLYDERLRTWGAPITTRTRNGARLVILEQHIWDATVLQTDLKVPLTGIQTVGQSSALENLFPEPSFATAVGQAIDFQRLNGLDSIALRVPLVAVEAATLASQPAATQPQAARLTPEAQATQSAAVSQPASVWAGLLLGYGRGDKPGWAVAYRDFGKGQVFACQVPLTDRVCTENPSDFDPVAERLLAFLIEGE